MTMHESAAFAGRHMHIHMVGTIWCEGLDSMNRINAKLRVIVKPGSAHSISVVV